MSLGFHCVLDATTAIEVTTGDTGLMAHYLIHVQTDGMDRYGPDGWLNISAQRDGKYISYWNNHISGSVKTTSDFLHGFERGTLPINSDPAGDLRRDEEEGERFGDTGDGGYTSPMWPHRRSWSR